MIVGRDTDEIEWKLFRGANESLFNQWVDHMVILADLVQNALDQDRVPVFEFLRLKLGSSKGHEDIVRSFRGERKGGSWVAYPTIRLQDEIPADTIDRSATPAQWVALTRSPDFVPGIGLPANPERRIRIRNQRVEPSDQLDFFPTGSGCLAVRDGYVELGAAFHHARIYRCVKRLKSGKETVFFAMMRVYQADLVGHRSDDLFKVDIPPQAISRRAAEGRLREAIDAGTAEYVGWIVTGDELLLDMSSQTSGAVAELLAAYPGTNRWSVDGLFASTRLRLRPKLLSGEGLPESAHTDVKAIIAGRGWLPSVSVVFGECRAVVVRRDVLGRPRLVSSRGLPVCWPTAPLNAREV
jgi:CRISPR-associated endonuclease Csn1